MLCRSLFGCSDVSFVFLISLFGRSLNSSTSFLRPFFVRPVFHRVGCGRVLSSVFA